jgi:hypothetical protein
VLRTGVSRVLDAKIVGREVNGERLQFETRVRLSLGVDKMGRRAVLPVMQSSSLKLDSFKNIKLTNDQQKDLKEGKNVLLKDPNSSRELLVGVDKKLNRIAGWDKADFMVPQKIGNKKDGFVELKPQQQYALKRGEAVTIEFEGGKAFKARVNPADRELTLTRTTVLKQDQVQTVKPTRKANLRKI